MPPPAAAEHLEVDEALETGTGERAGPRALAAAHREVHPDGRFFLTPHRLDELEEALGSARRLLRTEHPDDPSMRVAAEWLLDNGYLVRRVFHQLRTELPEAFQRRLPRLGASAKPRALALAEAMAASARHDPGLEALEGFVSQYQEVTPLTIAELWALPALLRLAVLERLRDDLEGALESDEPTDAGGAAGHAIRTLRLLAETDWKDVFSRQSLVERLLCEDPAGAYDRMDFDTRDAYRRALETVSVATGLSELEVARVVLGCAREGPPDGRHDHVGHWLVDAGRPVLERSLLVRTGGLERRLLERPLPTFFGLLVAAQLLVLSPVVAYLVWLEAPLAVAAVALLLCWIPSSLPATALAHRLLTGVLPPRVLPKLDFSSGIPTRWRTLVAVPALLGDDEEVDQLVAQLELHFLANPDPELRFALLTDHPDTAEPPGEEHAQRVARAAHAVDRLNRRHGGDRGGPFHLLHRDSRWNEAEGRWMGWERKRGKLEELNRYLRGGETGYTLHEGDPEGLADVAFVVTLDSDTQLPSGTAARLVGTLAHPLNRPVFDTRGRVRRGYTVVQPRVEISPRSARRSAFSRLFSGDVGIDIYSRAVSEVYQDLFGEGIYVGKGIYDLDAFRRSLEGRVPDNALLSHDLFEGIHGRAALATDIALYEDYPSDYRTYLHRLHRWMRGDWQLLRWLLPVVPGRGTGLPNRLGALGLFQIADNLRRSLVAPGLLALLFAGWLLLPGHPLFWTVAVIGAPGAAVMTSILRARGRSRRELGRWVVTVVFAPQEAWSALDVVARVLVRTFVTHSRMLEWTTASAAAHLYRHRRRDYLRHLWVGPAVALATGGWLALAAPGVLPWVAPWLILWLLSPEVAYRLGRPLPDVREELDEAAKRTLRHVARRTWLFYETFVGPLDNWLPPDHFQEHPRGVVAHRTSPTNIGMLLLSELAAYDLGYLGPSGLAAWLSNTLDALEQLERHRGHPYNWYDTRTLAPLEPRYVSTVDSGNLAGALLAVATGCERAAEAPALAPPIRAGLRDAAELLTEAVDRWAGGGGGPSALGARDAADALLDLLAGDAPGDRVWIDAVGERVEAIESFLVQGLEEGEPVSHDPVLLREIQLWLDRLERGVGDARLEADLLADPTRVSRLADRLRSLGSRARAVAAAMDFRFLYDEERRLFCVGFNVSADGLDPHHYDLLASEARLASFLAIVWRQVPVRHWFALGRPLTHAGRRGPALLSWGGSMFEYLMPRLLMRSHEDTLLEQSCRAAVDRQIHHGRAHHVPWGVSESGYALLDGQQAYQYRAFGVPGLGLRRGLEEDLVIAPYASMLALPYRPRAVVDNVAHLERLGMLGRFGLYEAADYHPRRAPAGGPAVVRSYMAHHHGMSLVAIDNLLSNDIMVDRFHADPSVEAGALLLDERVPGEVPTQQPLTEAAETPDVALTPVAALAGWTPEPSSPAVWAIGNDSLTSLVTGAGGGGLRWHGLAVTRWQPDPVADGHGAFVYLHDVDTGETIGATPDPVGGWPADGRVGFEAGIVEHHRRHEGLAVRLRVTVASNEDVELRELLVSNEGDRPRRIRVVGCLEPVLAPEAEDARHPAFSKLFLRCSPVPELAGVVVSRIARDRRPPCLLLHRLVADADAEPRLLTVDREAFLGRRGSYRAPAALTATRELPTEHSLDPVCATAAELVLEPGSRRLLTFVTAVAATRAQVLELGRRYGSVAAIRWAFDDAGRVAARRVERLAVKPELLRPAQRLLSALAVPDAALRAPASVLGAGRPSQRRLWGRGISGDEPIVAVRLNSAEPTELLEDLLDVHRYLRAAGVRVDLVLLDEAPSGYAEHGSEAIRRLLTAHRSAHLLHQRGGVHLVPIDQASPAELDDLSAAAGVHLDERHGSLAAQLDRRPDAVPELPAFEPAGPPPGSAPDPEIAIEVPELELDNGVGGFDGDEYVVRPGAVPPAPWCNVMANASFGCLVSEAALGSSWAVNAGENRLTPWHNDPASDPPSEALYLRDEETGRVWTTTPLPAGGPTLVRHGQGYTTYRSARDGIEQTTTVFVPPEAPVKIARLSMRNASARPRRFTATYYAEWVLGTRRAVTRPHVVPGLSSADACLLAEMPWSMDFPGRVAFLASERPLHGHTTDRLEMLGRGGDMAHPAALRRWGLSGNVAPGLDPCAALQVHVDLGPGEQTELSFFLGQADDRAAALELVRRLRAPGAVQEQWDATRAQWNRWLDAVRVRTPDPTLNRLANRWLLYQSLSSRFFGRTALYQSSGAFGFRDQLQDAIAFVHLDPSLTRRHLLECAAHQFVEGDVLHWWHPPGDAGVRTRCSDDLLWLVYVTHEYVTATGDRSVLDERVPLLSGPLLRAGEDVHYDHFPAATEVTLLEHCRRALARGTTAGPHGLPLIGDGDWNDGMSNVGTHGRGESVWLGWFLHTCTARMADLLEGEGEAEEARALRERLPVLAEALSREAWDGSWYRRAYHDDGTPIGSAHATPPHIDSIAQSWAVLSGAGEPDRIEPALAAVERMLVREGDRLVLLLAPPFGPRGPDPGYIAAYPPGVRENGGQYTHAATWLGFAHAARGDGDAAHRIFSLLNPLERTRTVEGVRRYRVEPYVIAADVYARPPWVGRGGWTWYTGSAAWMWRLAVEAILGLRRRDGALEVDPCIPTSWHGFEAWVREGELTVHVVVHDPAGAGHGVTRARLDRRPLDRARIPLDGRGERRLDVWVSEDGC